MPAESNFNRHSWGLQGLLLATARARLNVIEDIWGTIYKTNDIGCLC